MAMGDGGCHGSGRSIDGFSLHRALQRCAGHLSGFGGHDMAAGVRLETARLDAFADAFIDVANEEIAEDDLVALSDYDVEARIQDLGLSQVEQLERLAPFGRCNPAPIVRLRGLRVETRPETFGKYNKHLSLRASHAGSIAPQLRLVGWNWADQIEKVSRGAKIEALVRPRISIFAGSANVEGELVDLMVEP
jgi:single-stranded-DNA-specific exonuclease